jgi:hypothetical protein
MSVLHIRQRLLSFTVFPINYSVNMISLDENLIFSKRLSIKPVTNKTEVKIK